MVRLLSAVSNKVFVSDPVVLYLLLAFMTDIVVG